MQKEWFVRDDNNRIPDKVQSQNLVEGQWLKCPGCEKVLYIDDLEKNYYVCPQCQFHLNIKPQKRIEYLTDEKSFIEIDKDIQSADPLEFMDSDTTYKNNIDKYIKKTGLKEAVVTGKAKIDKRDIYIGVLDFNFSGGSMGSALGEKITRLIEAATKGKNPVIIISSSGGARMQEGIFSLMQMAKTSAALGLLSKNKLPFISILAHPTTGGVSASFAMLGDVIIAEPNALIGFAGPRVIEQTIKQKLPKGFQRSEFLLEHGLIDMVVHRKDLKSTVSQLLTFLS